MHNLIAEHKDDASKVELQRKLENLMFEFAANQTKEDEKMLSKFAYFEKYIKRRPDAFVDYASEVLSVLEKEDENTFAKYLKVTSLLGRNISIEKMKERKWELKNLNFAEIVFFLTIQVIFTNYLKKELKAQSVFLPLGRRVFKVFSYDIEDSEEFFSVFPEKFGVSRESLGTLLNHASDKLRAAQLNCGFTLFKIFSDILGLAKLAERESKKISYSIELSDDFFKIFSAEDLIMLTEPSYLPTVIPPLPWNIKGSGGYYFNNDYDSLQSKVPFVKESPFLKGIFSSDLSKTFNLINNLQRVPYKVEIEYLDLLEKILKDEALGLTNYEILKLADVFILPSAMNLMREENKKAIKEFKSVEKSKYNDAERVSKKYDYIKFLQKYRALDPPKNDLFKRVSPIILLIMRCCLSFLNLT